MNDATSAMANDMVKELAGKGLNVILSGAGGIAAKMILNVFLEGTTDPATAMLNKINDQLSNLKTQIKGLPKHVTIYQNYHKAISDSEAKLFRFKDMLAMTKNRIAEYGDKESYISTLKDDQWKIMESFLTPGHVDNANALISAILVAAYGLDKQDLTEKKISELKFGQSDKSYARYVSEGDLENLPVGIQDYLEAQVNVRDTVIAALTAIVGSAVAIIEVFKQVNAANPENGIPTPPGSPLTGAFSEKTLGRIRGRLKNKEIMGSFDKHDDVLKKFPKMLAQLLLPLNCATDFLCGNAFELYVDMLASRNFVLKNIATGKIAAMGEKEYPPAVYGGGGPKLSQYSGGKIENMPFWWRIKFADDNAVSWKISYIDHKNERGLLKLKAPGLGYLFLNPISSFACISTKEEVSNKKDCYWKVGLTPLADLDSGQRQFAFTVENISRDRALANETILGKSRLAYWKLDPKDANHQWDIHVEAS